MASSDLGAEPLPAPVDGDASIVTNSEASTVPAPIPNFEAPIDFANLNYSSFSTNVVAEETVPKSVPFKVPLNPRQGFVTGIDVTSAEEDEKRKKRAEKYGIPVYNPVAVQLNVTEDELKKRNSRIERFGVPPKDSLMDVDVTFEEERKEVPPMAPRRPAVVHMYGILDGWSTNDILKLFDEYGPQMVEWINDSSCNLVFADEFTARRVMVSLSTVIPAELVELKQNYGAVLTEQGIPEDQFQFICWRTMHINDPDRHILLRTATSEDVKLPPNMRKPSKYYAELRARGIRLFRRRQANDAEEHHTRMHPKSVTIKKQAVTTTTKSGKKVVSMKRITTEKLAEIPMDEAEVQRREKRFARFGGGSIKGNSETTVPAEVAGVPLEEYFQPAGEPAVAPPAAQTDSNGSASI